MSHSANLFSICFSKNEKKNFQSPRDTGRTLPWDLQMNDSSVNKRYFWTYFFKCTRYVNYGLAVQFFIQMIFDLSNSMQIRILNHFRSISVINAFFRRKTKETEKFAKKRIFMKKHNQ